MDDSYFRREHADLVADLRRSGMDVDTLDDWMRAPTPLHAKEILLHHLETATTDDLKELIARVLTQKGFEDVVPALVRAFESCMSDSARWGIANAIAYLGFPRQLWPDFLRLASDPRFGRGRQNIVGKLHHVKRDETEPLLRRLVHDPDVDAFALSALGYCGGTVTLDFLAGFTTDGRSPLFKRELPKAIRRISRRMHRT